MSRVINHQNFLLKLETQKWNVTCKDLRGNLGNAYAVAHDSITTVRHKLRTSMVEPREFLLGQKSERKNKNTSQFRKAWMDGSSEEHPDNWQLSDIMWATEWAL